MNNTRNVLHRLTLGFATATMSVILLTPAMAQSKPKVKSHSHTTQKRAVTPPKKLQQEQIQSQLDKNSKGSPWIMDRNVIKPKEGKMKYKGVIKPGKNIDKGMIIRTDRKKN